MRFLLAFALVAACGKNTEPPPPTSGSPMAQPESGPSKPRSASGTSASATNSAATAPDGVPEEAFQLFQSFCATCHGTDGSGNGPAAATLNPRPQSYADAAWQAKVTDDELKQAIVGGGQAVGKSVMMPASPQLKDKPEVVDGLVKIIRGFGKK